MNVDTIKNGLVIDHIRAGTGWRIFQWLGLDKAKFCCALIMNVESQKTGKKDIIKIEDEIFKVKKIIYNYPLEVTDKMIVKVEIIVKSLN